MVELGQRVFEIQLARRMVAGETQSTWFERHRGTPVTEIPAHWPADYRDLIARRLQSMASNPGSNWQPANKTPLESREPWQERLQSAAKGMVARSHRNRPANPQN